MSLGGILGAGALIGGALVGKKKSSNPTVDIAGMENLVKTTGQKQRALIGQQFDQLQPLSAQLKTESQAMGTGLEKKFGDISQQYRSGLSGIGGLEQKTLDSILSNRQVQSARNIPLQQQMIREQLAASGGFRTGGAARALQAPVLQQQQEQADLASQLATERLGREAERAEKGVDVQAEMAKQGALQKLGIDEDTMRTLFETGRTDIIEKLASLRGVEADELQSLLGIKGIQTQVGLAQAAANNARRQALSSSLMGIGGNLLGQALSNEKSAPKQ
jgi:hypothetical protein